MSDTKTNDGGPAFPINASMTCDGEVSGGSCGMTLRDYFAAKALPAVINDTWRSEKESIEQPYAGDWVEGIALDAYAIADAMLAARNKH